MWSSLELDFVLNERGIEINGQINVLTSFIFYCNVFFNWRSCLLSNLDYVEPIHRIGGVSTEDKNVSSSSNRTPASVWTRPYIYLSERTPISITQPDSGHLFHRYQPLQKTSQHNDNQPASSRPEIHPLQSAK